MADKKGYIRLNRNITEWGWYGNLKTCHVFIHLLLKANFKKGVFMGKTINRGQLAISRKNLALECNLTESEVDTALDHLKGTGEIRITRWSKCLVITIVNYNDYQEEPNQNRIKSESLTNHFRITSETLPNNRIKGNKGNKGKKGKKGNPPAGGDPTAPSERSDNDYPFKSGWRRKPDWMSVEVWERDKDMTVDGIPTAYRGQYDNVQDYLHDRETGKL